MSLVSGFSETAGRLLARFGEPMVLVHQAADPVYDPATGSATDTETIYTIRGYARSPSGQDLLDGSVAQTDLLVIVKVPEAAANDQLQIGASKYRVKSVRRPAVVNGQDIVFELVVSQ